MEDIKARLSIEDVISRYIELKRAGRNLRGLSPFSNEKTPSFMVSPEKQIWHDFSSGKGGNMFSFVMEMEGLDFKGALELLARQAGIDLSQYQKGDGKSGQQKARMGEALELATKFYQIHFSKNKSAYEYILKKRGFTKQTALEFKIGYSPNTGDSLLVFLKSKGFSENEIKQAGLSNTLGRSASDMFRGRIMIPLMDQFGKVVGFTARLLADNPSAPKYINTPQTPLYDKSRHVYGLHLAKEAIRKVKYSVVVEGNLDVIASHQAGVKQVVATAGTAVTEMQLKALGRFGPDVRLAFDQDDAGIQAAERSIAVANKAGVSLSIIDIKDAKDPDELIRKNKKSWQQVIDAPKYAVDWLIDEYKTRIDIATAPGKKQFSDILLGVIKNLSDSVEQDHYINEIAKVISVTPEALRQKLGQQKNSKPALRRAQPRQLDQDDTDRIKTQNHLLALCLMVPDQRPVLDSVTPEMMPEAEAKKLLKFLKAPGSRSKDVSETKALGELSDYVKMLVLLYEEIYKDLDATELHYESTRLQGRLVAKYVKIQKEIIASGLRETNATNATELLNKAKELDSLLKNTGGSN